MNVPPEQDNSDRQAVRRRRRVWRIRWVWTPLAVLTTASLIGFRRPLFQGNFGVVDPDRVFRSAQPDGSRLDRMIGERRLKSVLNLRGGAVTDTFYEAEVRVTEARGVDFYDFPMSYERRPTRREILILLDLLDRCRYPLLIHCKQGADRTGLVSALYLLSEKGRRPETAVGAFSLSHGHVPLRKPLGGTGYLHDPIDEYAGWLKARDLAHTPGRFREWVAHEYQSHDPRVDFRPLRPGPRKSLADGSAYPGRTPIAH